VKVRARGGSGLKRWTSACSPGKRGAARVSARSSHCRSLVDNDQNRGIQQKKDMPRVGECSKTNKQRWLSP